MSTKTNGRPVGASTSLLALSNNIADKTKEITQYLENNKLTPPSFLPNSIDVPDTPEYLALRSSLKESLEDLTLLVDGPKRSLRSFVCQANDLAAFQVAFDFELFSLVPTEGDISIEELATKAGLDVDRTARCVRMMATQRVFRESRPNFIAHTAASIAICKDEELRCAGQYMLDELFKAASATSQCLKTSPQDSVAAHSPFHTRHRVTMFQYYQVNPPHAARFAKAMAGAAKLDRQISELRDFYSWKALSGTVVDVGGGSGHISMELAKGFPHLNFVVQDGSLDMLAQGKALLSPSIQNRVTFMQHDFFTPQPMRNVAAFFIRQCTHNWCDRDVVTIFKGFVPGLEGSGAGTPILINDTVMPEPGSLPAHEERALRQMDMLMMVALGAKQRSRAEFKALLKKADPRYEVINCHAEGQMGLLEVHLKQ
ncbi:S-adenosyl-L-methionine-dependent methyltransferase [Xylariaceae sp. AK1471]|nr:S-adenosyl-L-methionine-dependent methyltransferase [Xylariaceae sp. AK1471]